MHGIYQRQRLVAIISVLLIAGFFGTSIASYLVSLSSLRSEIVTRGLPLTSDNIYSEIQKDLLHPVFISSMMASNTFLRDWALAGEQDVETLSKYLREVRDKYGTFTSFFVSEKTRKYYYFDGILKEIREDEPRDAWYFRVRSMTKDFETNVDPDLANGDALTVFTNYKVFDYSGNFIGAAGVGITVTQFMEIIEEYQQKYQRHVYFANKEGKVIIGGSQHKDESNELAKREGISEILPDILAADSGVFFYKWHGESILLNMRFIPELGWYLFVEQVEGEAAGSIWTTLLVNLFICAIITAIVLFATGFTIRKYQDRLEIMATCDKLTGLLNRQAFDLLFEQALKDADREKTPLALIMIDIDYFKKINDAYGHIAGDRLLKAIADCLREPLRKGDPLCRWGGEEFLVLLRDCGVDDAIRLAEKLRESVQQTTFFEEHPDTRVTISLGVGQYREGETVMTLSDRVDQALYAAKNAGRNCVKTA